MNTYKILFSLLIGTLFLAACKEEIDLKPYDGIETEEFFEGGINNFEAATKGAYKDILSETYWGGWYQVVPDVLADNVISSSEGRGTKTSLHYWTINSNSTWGGLWSQGYGVLRRVNLIMGNMDKLSDSPEKNNLIGELRALRAIVHFDMVRIFGDIPASGDATKLGVPYLTEDSPYIADKDIKAEPARESVRSNYDNIIDDLKSAIDLINTDNGTGRLNKAAAQAFLSRAYLYDGQYDLALVQATNSIESGAYALADTNSFGSVWLDELPSSIVFEVINTDQDDISTGVEYLQESSAGIRSEYVCIRPFYDMYQDNDIRKEVYFEVSLFAEKPFINIVKYRGRATGNRNVVNTKMMRASEVYLTAAEAAYRESDETAALGYLDNVRSNRYRGFVSPEESGQALLDAILLERRLELAFEGHRFFDIKRMGETVDRFEAGDEATGDGRSYPDGSFILPADDHRFNLAIPFFEMVNNSNMEQNPGY